MGKWTLTPFSADPVFRTPDAGGMNQLHERRVGLCVAAVKFCPSPDSSSSFQFSFSTRVSSTQRTFFDLSLDAA
jgi:hypothetical protein